MCNQRYTDKNHSERYGGEIYRISIKPNLRDSSSFEKRCESGSFRASCFGEYKEPEEEYFRKLDCASKLTYYKN